MGFAIDNKSYFMINEYLEEGSLFDHLHKKKTVIDEERMLLIVEDIALGMNYLHGRKVLHCDLKSSNVLIDSNWNVKLCDFGLSKLKDDKNNFGRVGTPHWMAPEILREKEYTEKSDVYSFGMILW
jgi:serine/threonine protein kinase